MAFALDDRVKETSTTTGTGTYSLIGAVAGFQTFVAGIGNGNTCWYSATDGVDWEVGIGTVTDAATDTLARTTILSSSNADAAVNWAAGTRTIACTFPAYAGLNKGLARAPQVYTTTGAFTWSKPTGLSYIIVEAVGGGGGGAGTTSAALAGSAGGAGGYARRTIAAASLGATETGSVGQGGPGGTTGGVGTAGSSTTFGTFLTACGGAPGATGVAAAGGGAPGGSGGLATSGDLNSQGGDGGYSSAGSTVVSTGNSIHKIGGDGGPSYFGGGGAGGIMALSGTTIVAGQPGKAKGSGGGGSVGTSTAAAGASGGSGAPGCVIISEYI